MATTIILPEHSELRSIQEKLELLKDIVLLPAEEKIEKITKRVCIDLTIDFFSRSIDPGFLYRLLDSLSHTLERIDGNSVEILILRAYPLRTNVRKILHYQKILTDYTQTLIEFFDAKQVFLPSIISRHCFQVLQSPPNKIIQAVRMEIPETIRYRKNSRFFVLYDRDFLEFLLSSESEIKKNIVVEGIEIPLEEIYEKSQAIAGQAPVHFDQQNFINYEYPIDPADSFKAVNYAFEDMLVDITSNLF